MREPRTPTGRALVASGVLRPETAAAIESEVSEGAAPRAEGLPTEALTRAIHHAMCDVSHHDSVTVCKNQRKYEMVAESVARHLEVRDAVDA